MKRNLKKGTALLLTGTIFMSTLSTTAFAAEPAKEQTLPLSVSLSTSQDNTDDFSMSLDDMNVFQKEFYKSLDEQGVNIDGVGIQTRGVKSKAAKQAAKIMLKKLYKIGSKSFNKAIKNAAKKIPNKKVAEKITSVVTYDKISAILNIVANVEGTITDALKSQIVKLGIPSVAADVIARAVVFVLL